MEKLFSALADAHLFESPEKTQILLTFWFPNLEFQY